MAAQGPIMAMKLSVLALDYDGTIADDRGLSQDVREVIAQARTSGVVVVLVTGRILSQLKRAAGDLHFVDAVVAENGAVLHFPRTEHTQRLAPAVSEVFLEGVARLGLQVVAGASLADADAGQAPGLLQVIRALELPLVLAFNRGRVMVLPQGVSKATGLSAALSSFRRSPRNTLAVGDAENDHEMLRLAEVGVAVRWGSPALCAAADAIVEGDGPASVAVFLRGLIAQGWLPDPARPRRRLLLGYADDGSELSLTNIGRNILIAGDAMSGKSWVGGLLAEQLILGGYSVCVIDPEGDYGSLEGLPGVTVLAGNDPPPTPRQLLEAFKYPDRSVVLDLSHLPHDTKVQQMRAILEAVNVMRRKTGLPHRIVVDEAHYVLHDPAAASLLDLELNGYTILTFCASRLAGEIRKAADVLLVTCESSPSELDCLFASYGPADPAARADWDVSLSRLPIGRAAMLPLTPEAGNALVPFSLAPRLTPHVRHRQKYVDVPVTDARAFMFTAHGHRGVHAARTLRDFAAEVEAAPPASLTPYLRRHDFSRWIRDVFGDAVLAAEIERHETLALESASVDGAAVIVDAIRGRYDLTDTGWERHGGAEQVPPRNLGARRLVSA